MNAPHVRTALPYVAASLLSLLPVLALAQTSPTQDVGGMSLEDLLAVEVSTASKFPQSQKEAPASTSIITSEDMRRFGYRTVAEALRGVCGIHTTYDRNYAYLGVRGFARPGDYNTRLLLLIDGHRVNDGIYDMAPVGTDFMLDIALIDRIEVIRGPASSLYGSNALFGVINVITKTGAGRTGLQTEVRGGSLDTAGALASYGQVFADGRELLFAASAYGSGGQPQIAIPEFDQPGAPAVAVGLDHDEAARVFGALSAGRFSFRGGAVHRVKQVPTASFGTVFGDGREATTDDRVFLNAVYDGPLGGAWMGTARLAYDYYGYAGTYPIANEFETTLATDQSRANAVTGELTARRRFGRRHLFTAGAEIRRDVENRQRATDGGTEYLNLNVPLTKFGLYVQDEIRPTSWLLMNVGVRLDRFSDFGTRGTPRAALVLLPRARTAIKLLHGRAFRAPNPYERFYFTSESGLGTELRPEQINSTEVVWEESLSRHLRLTAMGFAYDVEQIIEQRATAGGDIFFMNSGRTRGRGVEGEVEARLDNGVVARASHSITRVRDRDSGEVVSNSPHHLTSLSLQVPVSRVIFAVDGQHVGERLSLDGSRVAGYFAPNFTITWAGGQRFDLGLSFYNALDRRYSDPGAEEHLQPQIQQDGRTAQVRLRLKF